MDRKITVALLVFLCAVITTTVHSASIPSQQTAASPAVSHSQELHLPSHVPSDSTRSSSEPEQGSTRNKRAIIFRPLFVYRQQEIKRQKLKQMREQQQQVAAVVRTTQRPSTRQPVRYYASRYPYQQS